MDRAWETENQENTNLKWNIKPFGLIDIVRNFHPKMKKNTLSSQVHMEHSFSMIGQSLGHKSCLSTFQEIEIMPNNFSDHNAMRLDINYRERTAKKHKNKDNKQYISK